MRLFEVQTPTSDAPASAAFETELLALYGGFSSRTVEGAWQDPKTGTVYTEPMRAYHVATDYEPALAALAFAHFPAEKAVYVAEVGMAQIVERGQLQAAFAA